RYRRRLRCARDERVPREMGVLVELLSVGEEQCINREVGRTGGSFSFLKKEPLSSSLPPCEKKVVSYSYPALALSSSSLTCSTSSGGDSTRASGPKPSTQLRSAQSFETCSTRCTLPSC